MKERKDREMATKKLREWKVSEEINDTFSAAQAMEELRDKYIEKVFGYRKAARAAKEARKLNHKAWRMVRELHPDTPSNLTWWAHRGVVRETGQG